MSRIDARSLTAAGGLLLLATWALDKMKPGDVLEILSDDPSAPHDLSAWSRLTANRWLGTAAVDGRQLYRIEKGPALRVLADRDLDWGNRAALSDGRFDTRQWLAGQAAHIERTASPSSGFAPRGAVVER